MYKVTLTKLLFPASIKKETKQIFVSGKELSGVKKINFKRKIL